MKQSGLVLSVDRIVVSWELVLVCVLHRNKTMAAVYVTNIPCKLYKAHKVLGKSYFCNICLCANNIEYFRFEGFRNFLTLLWALLVKNFHVLRTTGECTSCHHFLTTKDCAESGPTRAVWKQILAQWVAVLTSAFDLNNISTEVKLVIPSPLRKMQNEAFDDWLVESLADYYLIKHRWYTYRHYREVESCN